MPIYEYNCRSCNRRFELIVQGSERPKCPACGGKDLAKQLSVFAVATGGHDDSGSELPGPCRSCGHPGGPGSCGFE